MLTMDVGQNMQTRLGHHSPDPNWQTQVSKVKLAAAQTELTAFLRSVGGGCCLVFRCLFCFTKFLKYVLYISRQIVHTLIKVLQCLD